MPEIVFDCCVVSNFALAGALDVLEGLYMKRAFINIPGLDRKGQKT